LIKEANAPYLVKQATRDSAEIPTSLQWSLMAPRFLPSWQGGRQLLIGCLLSLAWLAVAAYVFFAILAQAGSWTWEEEGPWADLREKLVIE
jgi:hypothetical protein